MSVEARPVDIAARTKSEAQSFVERQLKQTSSLVRFNDILATIFGGLAWIASVLFVAILVDAWAAPLTPFWRWIFLLVLIGGWTGFTAWRLFPVLFRRINPTFTARMIESTSGDFHNSIVNYTFLQDDQKELNPHVVHAVSQKAAQDLAKVSGSERIDRSSLIRFGLTLVTLTGLFVAYVMLSPKSPWQTIARVFSPLSELARPSSVTIENVQPGDAEVFFGRKLLVSANVQGKHDPDSVALVFSTADKRLSEVRQFMRPAEGDSNLYQLELTTSPQGIDSSLTYRIEVGDGRTRDFEVKVNANPTIAVNNVVIKSPGYTKIPERSFSSTADLSGPEGANVKVFAAANLPIKVAAIELLSQTESVVGEPSYSLVTSIPMAVTENSAVGEFTLYFDRRANKPDFTHFQLKFTSIAGDRNEIANVYPIRIIPDLGPEIKISNPKEKEIRVPVNHSAQVAIIANDLDYELNQVRLVVDHRGVTAIEQEFALPESGDRQIFSGKYTLRPEDLKLKPGDEILFYAKATDNRHSSVNALLEPNEARTENYRLIVEPHSSEPDPQPSDPETQTDDENKNDQNKQDQNNDSMNKDDQSKDEKGQPQNAGSEDNPEESKSDDDKTKNDKQEKRDNETQEDDQDKSVSRQKSGDKNPDESNDKENAKDESFKSSSEKEKGHKKQEDTKDNRKGDEKGESDAGKEDTQQGEGDEQNSGDSEEKDAERGGSSKSADQPSDKSNDTNSKSNSKSGKGKKSDPQSDSEDGQRDESLTEGEEKPLDQDATDTERFEQLRRMMEKDQKQNKSKKEDSSNSPENSKEDKPENSSGTSEDEKSEKNDGKSDQASSSNSKEDSSSEDGNKSKDEKQKQGSGKSPSTKQGDSSKKPSAKSDQESGNEPNNPKPGDNVDGNPDEKQKKDDGDSNSSQDSDKPPPDSPDKSKPGGGSDSGSKDSKSDEGADGPEKSGDAKGGKNSGSKSSGEAKSKSGGGSPNGDSDSKGNPQSTDPSKSPASSAGTGGGKESGGIPDKAVAAGQKTKQEADDNSPDQSSNGQTVSDAEEFEYKKETTDLVLKYLKEQEESTDKEALLRQLNMTHQQLKEFLQRWQAMADKAKSGDASAAQQYERALRALGLRNRNAKIKGADTRMENLSEGSAVSRPPAEVESAFLDYLKSINRSTPGESKK